MFIKHLASSDHSRHGFTLIELLVVIGIIGVLTAVLIVSLAGVTDSAKATVCLNNIRQLAMSVRNVATASGNERGGGSYPVAGTCVYSKVETDRRVHYAQIKGWLSAAPNAYDRKNDQRNKIGVDRVTFDADLDTALHAITNGVIWSAMDRNLRSYQCPIHVAGCRKNNKSLNGRAPAWSYAMNPQFGYDSGFGGWQGQSVGASITIRDNSNLKSWGEGEEYDGLDHILLFAELPAIDATENATVAGMVQPVFTGSGKQGDGVLDYMDGECIGFNHKSGKRYSGHVAFLDGHAEKIMLPLSGDINELTRWMCQGCTLSFGGSKYVKESSPLE